VLEFQAFHGVFKHHQSLDIISSKSQKLQLHLKLSPWFATGFLLGCSAWEGCHQRREKYAWNSFFSVLAAKLFADWVYSS
jgi:hypothetical protein